MTIVAPKLSIVIPVYNEARRIRPSLDQLVTFVKRLSYSCEVLIVVEKSSDGTLQIAREILRGNEKFKVIGCETHRGKGFAVKTGMLQAQGEYVVYMDLDLSTPLSEIERFLNSMQADPSLDVLIGNRRHPESQIIKR